MSDQVLKSAIEVALKNFASQPLSGAATHLFETLGYASQKHMAAFTPNTYEQFLVTFAKGKVLNEKHSLPSEWKSVDFLFQLTDEEIRNAGGSQFEFESTVGYNGSIIKSYLFFAIELKGVDYTRTALAGITRELNKLFPMPALVLFRHGEMLTLSIINRRMHKKDESKDVLEKVTLIQDIQCTNTHRAHLEILSDLSIEALHGKYSFTNFDGLQGAWRKTLDTSVLNKRFFQDLANWYFWALSETTFPKHAPKDADGHDSLSLIRLITRVIFCWFLKEKGLLPDALFDPRKAPPMLKDASSDGSTYYKAILQNLFFATLNQEMNKREFRKEGQHFMAHNLYRYRNLLKNPDEVLALFADIPFMNGGLFECLDKVLGTKEKPHYIRIDGFSDRSDNQLACPNDLFFGAERVVDLSGAFGEKKFTSAKVRGLIHILEHYKFTVTENTPIEEEIALDPELLGKVFENLLAAYNPETGATARKQTGSFYTPREIVDYMVDESLIATLKTTLEASHPDAANIEDRLRHLFAYNDQQHQFIPPEVNSLIEGIDLLKILDPACGSGAFPMGALHKLVFVLGKLDPGNKRWKARQLAKADEIPDSTVRERVLADIEQTFGANELDYGRKLYLIENCIYGVDIQPIAVQISKLRFFISLIVDQKMNPNADNLGIRPLPNLETKFVAANTLIGIDRPGQQLLRNLEIDAKEADLRRVRERHFLARGTDTKRKYREQDTKLRGEIAELLKGDGWNTDTARMLALWDPYDQNASAEFFDTEWMFGLPDGFDVVIANPPYVRQEKIKEFKKVFQKLYECYTGVADLYVYFYERSCQLLKDGGILTFISSNKYFRAAYGEKLRGLLATRTTIELLIDFGDAPVFTAIAYPSIIVARKAPPIGGAARVLTWQPGPPIEEFGAIFAEQSFVLERHELSADGWRLESPAVLRLIDKLRAAGKPLGEYVRGRFYYGIKTGLNEAFVVDRETRDRLIAEHPSSKEVLKPFLRGRDVKRWVVEPQDLWLCYVGWEFPVMKHPAIFKHLQGYEQQLRNRPEVKEGRVPWYAMSRYASDYWEEFDRTKIIYPDIAVQAEFALDASGGYIDCTLFMIPQGGEYLVGVLNSRVIRYFFPQICPKVRGDFMRFKSIYVTQIPIPSATAKQRTAITKLVERILSAKEQNAHADVAELEREIDSVVYKLYGLDDREIGIIEALHVRTSVALDGTMHEADEGDEDVVDGGVAPMPKQRLAPARRKVRPKQAPANEAETPESFL